MMSWRARDLGLNADVHSTFMTLEKLFKLLVYKIGIILSSMQFLRDDVAKGNKGFEGLL